MTDSFADIVDKSISEVFSFGKKKKDAVQVKFGNTIYEGWTSVSIRQSLESLCRSFTISITDKWRQSGGKWPFQVGADCYIQVGDEYLITGYVDKLDVSYQNGNRQIVVSGRDRTADIVDSSSVILERSSYELKNVTIESVAKRLITDSFRIKVNVGENAKTSASVPFKIWTINPGESIFETLQRMAKLRGLLLIADGGGNLVITQRAGGDSGQPPSLKKHKPAVDLLGRAVPSTKNLVSQADFLTDTFNPKSPVDLIQGENILECRATYDNSDRYQVYITRGQTKSTDLLNRTISNQISESTSDLAVRRKRQKLIIANAGIDSDSAKKRSNWEASVRATKAIQVSVKIQGWLRKSGGKETLWKINELVRLESRFVGIETSLLVTGVSFNKSKGEGTTTTLKLTRPDSYIGKKDELSLDDDPATELGWQEQAFSDVAKFIEDTFS